MIWYVSEGEYSAYEVKAVFGSEEVAALYAAGDEHRRVEGPFEIRKSLPSPVQWLTIRCQVTEDGTDLTYHEEAQTLYPGIDDGEIREYSTTFMTRIYGTDDWSVFLIIMGEAERTRKVFSETRAQAIADFLPLLARQLLNR